jgi:kynurenine formamidase
MPTPRGPRLVELSHPIAAGMTTYPGQPGPEITAHLTREASRAGYAPGTEFAIERITMIGNTGTYLDSPYHRYPDAVDLAGLPLEALAALPAAVARLTDAADRAIDVDALAALDVPGHAVLPHTGWDRHWGTDRYGRDTPTSPGMPRNGWSTTAPGWSASTRSTSTTRPTARGRSLLASSGWEPSPSAPSRRSPPRPDSLHARSRRRKDADGTRRPSRA